MSPWQEQYVVTKQIVNGLCALTLEFVRADGSEMSRKNIAVSGIGVTQDWIDSEAKAYLAILQHSDEMFDATEDGTVVDLSDAALAANPILVAQKGIQTESDPDQQAFLVTAAQTRGRLEAVRLGFLPADDPTLAQLQKDGAAAVAAHPEYLTSRF